jgi:hypothetical protein
MVSIAFVSRSMPSQRKNDTGNRQSHNGAAFAYFELRRSKTDGQTGQYILLKKNWRTWCFLSSYSHKTVRIQQFKLALPSSSSPIAMILRQVMVEIFTVRFARATRKALRYFWEFSLRKTCRNVDFVCRPRALTREGVGNYLERFEK